MNKVLLIGYIWPYHTMAGNCIYAIARFLEEYGWQPIVLTTPLPKKVDLPYKVVEVPFKDPIKKLVSIFGFDTTTSVEKQIRQRLNIKAKRSILSIIFKIIKEVSTYPDTRRGWKKPAINVGSYLIKEENIKAIITDNPPIVAQLIASELKQRYNIPWIVYLSHLWSQNNGYSFSSVRRTFDRRLEVNTLVHADLMISHSEHQAAKQRALLKGVTAISVFEGFPPEAINDPPSPLTEKFTITYTGTFAPGLREPGMLLSALKNLITSKVIACEKVEIRFYGTRETWIDNEIERLGLSKIVKQYGRVTLANAQAKQRESQVLYNPKWDDPYDPGIYAGKLFEYLAARRPILATGKYRDVVDDILAKTGAGVSVSSIQEIERTLEALYNEYLKEGSVMFRGDVKKLSNSSHRDLARIFAGELDRLTG